MSEGLTVGVFGSEQASKLTFESSVAKKSEVDGVTVYHRKEGEKRISFLDDAGFPERIQGYASIASFSDLSVYLYPQSWKLSPTDGELAVLLNSFKVPGSFAVETIDESLLARLRGGFKGTVLDSYTMIAKERWSTASSVFEPGFATPREDFRRDGTLIYVDRVFNVKGLGTVALGFILSGSVSVHDSLRPIPLPKDCGLEVKGIQINDVDMDSAGRGIRVGLALKGADVRELQKTHWLDDSSFALAESLVFEFAKSPFYRQPVVERDLHVQLPGEMVPAFLDKANREGELTAKLASQVPTWKGMRLAVMDLNGRPLRVAGGGTLNL